MSPQVFDDTVRNDPEVSSRTASHRFQELKNKLFVNHYFLLTKFLVPIAFTDVAVDIAEQFLNRSIAQAADVVETLASFGLAYVLVKFFVGVLGEVRQAGLVLVHDRPSYYKILICTLVGASSVVVLLIIIAETKLGVLLIQELHGVTPSVSKLTTSAIAYLSVYPLIDAISWYHAGILLKWHHSTVVGAGSLADIFAQILAVAVLLYTPLICNNALLVPILAAYAGVATRCSIVTVAYFRSVYPLLKKEKTVPVSIFKLVSFLSPLMVSLGIQRISRPVVNLLVARFAASKCDATEAVAVLTATYPFGHLPYGWLNQLKPVSPAFQKEKPNNSTPVLPGRTIGIFCSTVVAFSATMCFILFWIPGVSVAVLEHVIGVPHQLAVLCVDPLKLFAFLSFAVGVRAPLVGWLTLHHQTKLILPSVPVRVCTILALLFALPHLGLTGAFMGVLSLVSGFFTETLMITVSAVCYSVWKHCKKARIKAETSTELLPTLEQEIQHVPIEEATATSL